MEIKVILYKNNDFIDLLYIISDKNEPITNESIKLDVLNKIKYLSLQNCYLYSINFINNKPHVCILSMFNVVTKSEIEHNKKLQKEKMFLDLQNYVSKQKKEGLDWDLFIIDNIIHLRFFDGVDYKVIDKYEYDKIDFTELKFELETFFNK